jgi:class 3 adenylate cyclase
MKMLRRTSGPGYGPPTPRTVGHATLRTDGACARRRLALMFTDIVDSTAVLVELGDETWLALLRWHDAVLRSCFRAHAGYESNQAGDGFFTVFERPAEALQCALDIQRQLAEGRHAHGFALHVRIGIQWVDVLEMRGTYFGLGVHEAARINEVAGPDEVLMSAAAFDAASHEFGKPRPAGRHVALRGLPEPLELVSLHAAGPDSDPAIATVSADVTAAL